jgi:hypothetical protein
MSQQPQASLTAHYLYRPCIGIADADATMDALPSAPMRHAILICDFVKCSSLPGCQRGWKEQLHAGCTVKDWYMMRVHFDPWAHAPFCSNVIDLWDGRISCWSAYCTLTVRLLLVLALC